MKIKQFSIDLLRIDIQNCSRISMKHWVGSRLLNYSFWWMKSVELTQKKDDQDKPFYSQYIISKENAVETAFKITSWALLFFYAFVPLVWTDIKQKYAQLFLVVHPLAPLLVLISAVGAGLLLKGCSLLDPDVKADYRNYFKLKRGEHQLRKCSCATIKEHKSPKKEKGVIPKAIKKGMVKRLKNISPHIEANVDTFRDSLQYSMPTLLRSLMADDKWSKVFSIDPILVNHWNKEMQVLHGPKMSGFKEEVRAPSLDEFGSHSLRWGYRSDLSILIFIKLSVSNSKKSNYIILDSSEDWKHWKIRLAGKEINQDGLRDIVNDVNNFPIKDGKEYDSPELADTSKMSLVGIKPAEQHALKLGYLLEYFRRIVDNQRVGFLRIGSSAVSRATTYTEINPDHGFVKLYKGKK